MTIELEHIVFLFLSGIMLGSAGMVVTSRNLFHAGLYLMVSLFGVAGLFILLGAFFLGVVQVVVYIGAIAILILLAVMMTPNVTQMEGIFTPQWMAGAAVAVIFAVMLISVVSPVMDDVFDAKDWNVSAFDTDEAADVGGDPVAQLGEDLVDPHMYMLPFEVASLLLMAAMIGAVLLVNPGEADDDQPASPATETQG